MEKDDLSIAETTLESNEQLETSIYNRSDRTLRVATPEPEVMAAVNSNSGSAVAKLLNLWLITLVSFVLEGFRHSQEEEEEEEEERNVFEIEDMSKSSESLQFTIELVS